MRKIVGAALSAIMLAGCWTSNTEKVQAPEPEAQDVLDKEEVRYTRKVTFADRLAANGIVLLKNEAEALPLPREEEVVLLGAASYLPPRAGWASASAGNASPSYAAGLEAAGVTLNPVFAMLYRNELQAGRLSAAGEPDLKGTFDELAAGLDRGTPCVVTIARAADEGRDFAEARGSFRLSADEEALLASACRAFDTVIVLLNTPGVIDTSFMETHPIKALVHTSFLGERASTAVANVLTGRITPSGKTVDTWARRYSDYGTTDCFGAYEVPYREGSFIGYRHFDANGLEARYPFGFGLSYTSFDVSVGEAVIDGTRVTFPVTVRNTGSRRGAEVVQVYLSRPGRIAAVEPVKQLCAFAKTRTIAPRSSQKLEISVDLKDCAIYDEESASWILTAGTYVALVGNSSANTAVAATLSLPRTVVEKTVNQFASTPAAHEPAEVLPASPFEETLTLEDVVTGIATVEQIVAQLSDEELIAAVCGQRVDETATRLWTSEKYAALRFLWTTDLSGVRGAAEATDDAGTEEPVRYIAWPCATAIAQTWDPLLAEWYGRLVADDMVLGHVDGWQVPSVSLHRNPLGGRNFESFSEDPYLSGKLGAAVVRGVQTKPDGSVTGRSAALGRFCTNNQETQADEQVNLVSEKALREVYLKPFEMVVKESQPQAIVAGVNRLNGEPCSESERLLTGILRDEWGFRGLVMTPSAARADRVRALAAGSDFLLPGTSADADALRAALADGTLARGDLQKAVVRLFAAPVTRLSIRQ